MNYIVYNDITDPKKPEDVILFFTNSKSSGVARKGITKQPEANSACKCVNIFLHANNIEYNFHNYVIN